jgi:prepilin-type N-terminal cleavage/methylation domain-containing protein
VSSHFLSNRARGFSLVELMVALVAGLIVSAAVLAFFFSGMRSNAEFVQSTRLTQELRNTMDIMTRELSRAGYDQNALGFLAQANTSPFAPVCIAAAATGDCVIFAYDSGVGTRGLMSTGGNFDLGEVRGIRFRQVTFNGQTVGVIEYAKNSTTVKPRCNGAIADYTTSYPPQCNGTSLWCPLSDPAVVNITQLTLTNGQATAGSGTTLALVRDIGIDLRGQLASSTEFTRGMASSVHVRTDCTYATQANCNAFP